MTFAPPRWFTFLLVPTYVILANVALAWRSPLIASLACALLTMLAVSSLRGPRLAWARWPVAAVGIWFIQATARELVPPLALMLPPVVIPASLAWMFGHTLMDGRMALVERFARAVHAPEPLDGPHAAYARSVTVMWTLVLISMTLANLALVMCLTPGGLLQEMGLPTPWTVELTLFLWLSNGVYLLIAVVLAAEFAFRLWRFPNYRFSNPLVFMQRARERLPAVIEDLRRG